jgi:hypothetical protein
MPADSNDPAERGRYAVHESGDGGMVIARAAPLCEKCQACGCGDQQTPITIPGHLVKLARAAASGEGGMAGKLRQMTGLMRL